MVEAKISEELSTRYAPLVKYLEQYTGRSVKSLGDIQDLYEDLKDQAKNHRYVNQDKNILCYRKTSEYF